MNAWLDPVEPTIREAGSPRQQPGAVTVWSPRCQYGESFRGLWPLEELDVAL